VAAPVLVLLCGHAGRDGRPLPESPDTIVRAAHDRVQTELGLELQALGEVEYFLGRRQTQEDIYGADDKGYHASSPFVFGEALRRRALTLLAEIGAPVKYGHSEVGYIAASDLDDTIWEQHEVELALAPLPDAAEHVALTQWILRNLAHQMGMRCSFDPIMRKGHAGSGLHFHFSPVQDGRCIVRGAGGELSVPAQWLLAGLVLHGAALMAFGNRRAGSFIRISQAKEAPSVVAWGAFDRSALVRLPLVAQTADGRSTSAPTVEFRLPDGSAHPHLLLAGVAQAFLAARPLPDLAQLLEQTTAARVKEDPGDAEKLPRNFREVGEALAAHRDMLAAGDVFPAGLLDNLIANLLG
jgi:glutamine synthetase